MKKNTKNAKLIKSLLIDFKNGSFQSVDSRLLLNRLSHNEQIELINKKPKIAGLLKNPNLDMIDHLLQNNKDAFFQILDMDFKMFIAIFDRYISTAYINGRYSDFTKKLFKNYQLKNNFTEAEIDKIIDIDPVEAALYINGLSEKNQLKIITKDIDSFSFLKNPCENTILKALKNDLEYIWSIDNPTEAMYDIVFSSGLEEYFPTTRKKRRTMPVNTIKKYFKRLDDEDQKNFITDMLAESTTNPVPSTTISLLADIVNDPKLKSRITRHKKYRTPAQLITDEFSKIHHSEKTERFNDFKKNYNNESFNNDQKSQIINDIMNRDQLSKEDFIEIITKYI